MSENKFTINYNKLTDSCCAIVSNRKESELKKFTNEFLWEMADRGNKKALSVLYNKTMRLWYNNKVPVDITGVIGRDDWVQMAGLEFLKKWQRYSPKKGYKFNTFIVTVITNMWRNKIRNLKNKSNQITQEAVKGVDFSTLMVAEFCSYDDDVYKNLFLGRFRDYLTSEVPEKVLSVYDVQILGVDTNISYKDISKMLKVSMGFVQTSLSTIREHAIDFGNIEKGLRYGY